MRRVEGGIWKVEFGRRALWVAHRLLGWCGEVVDNGRILVGEAVEHRQTFPQVFFATAGMFITGRVVRLVSTLHSRICTQTWDQLDGVIQRFYTLSTMLVLNEAS